MGVVAVACHKASIVALERLARSWRVVLGGSGDLVKLSLLRRPVFINKLFKMVRQGHLECQGRIATKLLVTCASFDSRTAKLADTVGFCLCLVHFFFVLLINFKRDGLL